MARAFISYSSKSKNLVEALVEDIETAGYQAWFDHKLTGGQAWWEQILAQIRECDLFVFALTPDALDSVPCQREYQYAHQIGKNILPVLLTDGVSVNLLPLELSVIQFVDYRHPDRQSGIRLISALNGLPPLKPLPDPLPTSPEVPISYVGNLKDQIEAPGVLTFEEQASLILKLKTLLEETDAPQDAIELLHRFKRREDLLARIDKEIDALLADAQGSPSPRAEPASATPPPQPAAQAKPSAARPRGADPFAPQADPFAATAATSRPAPAPSASRSQPGPSAPRASAPSRSAPRGAAAGSIDWITALVTATIGWGITGVVISVPLLLLLTGTTSLYFGFLGLIIRGAFALMAGALSGYVTHRALRSGLRTLDGSGMQRMVVWFAVASVQEVVMQLVSTGSEAGSLIGLILSWAIISWATINVLRPQLPGLNGRGVVIAWGVAYLLFFLLSLSTQEAFYWMDLMGLVIASGFITTIGNGLIGLTGVGLTLREAQQHAALPTPEGASLG
jgi:hypothetical protein